MQVGGAADFGQQALAFELPCDGDGVSGLGAPGELDDRVEDGLMAGLVEVLGAQDLGDDGHRFGGEHHGSQDAHLGVDVLGRDPVEFLVCHGAPFLLLSCSSRCGRARAVGGVRPPGRGPPFPWRGGTTGIRVRCSGAASPARPHAHT